MKRILLFISITLISASLYAKADDDVRGKDDSIKGIVLSKNSDGTEEPVIYATVYWDGSDIYAECNENGEFSIRRSSNHNRKLITTALGFVSDTLSVGDNDDYLEIVLRTDNVLNEVVVYGKSEANYISKLSTVKTEVISAAGLCKMACCNLAESFENSASVSVGYSDAITGARQIKLLGLSGIYTSMLDENRPVMRGLAAPFGMAYIPGQWLESIQIAKGPSSVINGIDAITGQINMEHRKPTDEKPFFLNLFLSSMLRAEMNIASSLQLNHKWSTVILAHASTDPMAHDANKDGFRDGPGTMQFNFANRWLYYAENGTQIRFGVKALYDDRVGGHMDFHKRNVDSLYTEKVPWGTNIVNSGANAFVKAGFPLNEDNSHNIAVIADYTYHRFDSHFGVKSYFGEQNSGFLNIIYQGIPNDSHRFSFGVRNFFDDISDRLHDGRYGDHDLSRVENMVGVYGEYTYTYGDKFTGVADVSIDYNNRHGFFVSPRLNLKYSPFDFLVFRAMGGRGIRTPNIVVDNLGIMSTGRRINIADNLDIESAWTYGGNITGYIPIGFNDNCYISFDYFRSDFTKQVIVDQEYNYDPTKEFNDLYIYNLDGRSYTNTYQVDFSIEPVERFTILATFRYTDSKVTLKDRGLVDRPLISKYKGVLNLQYATRMNLWTFDLTLQVNGPSRIPDFAVSEGRSNMSPVYPVLYMQVTRKFKGVDVYIGADNITNYRQKNPIINAENPYAPDFNASVIWGPLMGIKVYAGMRFTLWK